MKGQFYCRPSTTPGDGCTWRLVNDTAGAGASETNEFTVLKLALWGERHVINPEVFIHIDVAPDKIQQWQEPIRSFNNI